MPYTKPYRTVPQQRQLLEKRGMGVPDIPKAEEYLQRIGYYRLSAYWYPFRAVHQQQDGTFQLSDDFKDRTEFKHSTDLYAFDKALRLLVLDAIERIEISVRTEVSLALGLIDPLAHRNAANFNGRLSQINPGYQTSQYDKWINKLDYKEASSKEDFAEHFRNKHPNEHMPIWIAVELLDFGPLSILLSNFLQPQQRLVEASYGGTSFRLLRSWIRALCGVRNVCAHHSRLWNKSFVDQPAIPRAGEAPELDHLTNAPDTNKRIYAALAIMRFLLRQVNPRTKWADRLKDHIKTFPDNAPNIKLSDSGFPDDWENLPLWN